jgi:hypothetical protein
MTAVKGDETSKAFSMEFILKSVDQLIKGIMKIIIKYMVQILART